MTDSHRRSLAKAASWRLVATATTILLVYLVFREWQLALGVGGFPRGRVVEIYGPESSGKTTLALHAVAEVQKQGGVAAFVDAEHALDVGYARRLGVKVEDLLVSLRQQHI